MVKRILTDEVFQGDTTSNQRVGIRDDDGELIDISSGYVCTIVADGVNRTTTDMDGNTQFIVNLTAAETAALSVGEHEYWAIITNASLATSHRHRIDLTVLENEVPG